jgi:hypothetical protein
VKSSGFVVSMTTLPRKFSGPASLRALSFRHAERCKHHDLAERGRLRECSHRGLRHHFPRPGERLFVLRFARAHLDIVAQRDEALAQRFSDIAGS